MNHLQELEFAMKVKEKLCEGCISCLLSRSEKLILEDILYIKQRSSAVSCGIYRKVNFEDIK